MEEVEANVLEKSEHIAEKHLNGKAMQNIEETNMGTSEKGYQLMKNLCKTFILTKERKSISNESYSIKWQLIQYVNIRYICIMNISWK